MRAVFPAIDAELMLQKDRTHATDIQKVGRASVLGDILLENIKTNAAVVSIPFWDVVDGYDLATLQGSQFSRHRIAKIVAERTDAAATWRKRGNTYKSRL
jgi:hypothetical protein